MVVTYSRRSSVYSLVASNGSIQIVTSFERTSDWNELPTKDLELTFISKYTLVALLDNESFAHKPFS